MNVRELPEELHLKTISELNENPKRVKQDVEDLRSWLKHQVHLQFKNDDQFLLGILRRCKFSMEKSKKKLETYYTMKTFAPEFFMSRDPFSRSIQSFLTTKTVYINSTFSSPTMYYVYWKNIEDMGLSIAESSHMFFMNMDILTNENDSFVINGFYFILDFKDVPLSAYLKWDINLTKKVFTILNGYPIRIKYIIAVNADPVIEKIYNILKLVLSEKIQKKVILLNKKNSDKLFEVVPRDLIPKEFGGTASNLDKTLSEWKNKVESYCSWFKEDEKYKTNEELRVGKPKTLSEIFSVDGSFRKLDWD
ncbi:hypothetical protein FQR65_LT06014 [Abscondita terminalis]|nr:hypothetical protein FQR65_LT06014 [Abscondita terminalis]